MSQRFSATRPVFAAAAHVSIGSAASLISSVAVTLIATSLFGVTRQTDAFFMALLFPQMIAAFLSQSPSVAAIPVLVRTSSVRGTASAAELTSVVLWIVTAGLVIVGGLQLAARDPLLHVVAPGFSADDRRLTAELMLYTVPATVCGGVVNVLAALLNIRHRYFLPAFAPALMNAIIIAALVVAGSGGVRVWALAELLGSVAALGVLVYATTRAGQTAMPPRRLVHPDTRALLAAVLPFTFIGGLGQLTEIVGRAVASAMAAGVVSALTLAVTLTNIPVGLSAYALGTALVPAFARSIADRDTESIRLLFDRSIRTLSVVLAPIALFFVVMGEPIVQVVFERGTFDARATMLTADILRIFGLSLVVQPFVVVANRALLGARATSTLVAIGVLETTIQSALAVTLGGVYGHIGLASAYLLAIIASAVLVTIASRRNFERAELAGAAVVAAWAVCYAILAALAAGLVLEILRASSGSVTWWAVALALGAGSAIYLVLLQMSRVSGIRDVRDAFRTSVLRQPTTRP